MWPNANMGDVRVHYFIDETDCWQQLREDEVGGLYKVQVGAYMVKTNATAMLNKIKAAGYDAFITANANTAPAPAEKPAVAFSAGDKVKCNAGVKTFSNGSKMASWVPTATLYVRAVEQGGKILLVSTEKKTKRYIRGV